MSDKPRFPLYADWPDAMKQPPDPELAALANRYATMARVCETARVYIQVVNANGDDDQSLSLYLLLCAAVDDYVRLAPIVDAS